MLGISVSLKFSFLCVCGWVHAFHTEGERQRPVGSSAKPANAPKGNGQQLADSPTASLAEDTMPVTSAVEALPEMDVGTTVDPFAAVAEEEKAFTAHALPSVPAAASDSAEGLALHPHPPQRDITTRRGRLVDWGIWWV